LDDIWPNSRTLAEPSGIHPIGARQNPSIATEKQNALLSHLERTLGSFEGHGVAEPDWNIPFSASRFDL
jgi:hypothetical protein